MAANTNLHKAKNAKNDEFYTQLTDVAKELMHYKHHFKDKIVFCNCDDPTWSAFWKYFHLNFEALGLKKLISTHYDKTEPTYKMEYTGGDDNDIEVGVKTPLEGNGDFRNAECIELLKESDIVVTNPPFSLFREYVAQLMEYEKKFLIIGNKNAVTNKEFFPLISANNMWIGVTPMSKDMLFTVPKEKETELVTKSKSGSAYRVVDGVIYARAAAIWFTNLDHKKRHEKLILWKNYTSEEYPTYDNYDAIEVSKVSDIPIDYDGVMGVPISYMDKYCPEQFEILGCTQRGCHDLVPDTKKYDDYKEINHKTGMPTGSSGGKTNENTNLARNDGKHNYFMNAEGHIVQSTYSRIFIRRKAGV